MPLPENFDAEEDKCQPRHAWGQGFSRDKFSLEFSAPDSMSQLRAFNSRQALRSVLIPAIETSHESDLGSDTAAKLDEFQKAHRIEISKEHGQFVYKLAAQGKSTELFRTEASKEGLRQGEKQLTEIVSLEQKKLESKFQVSFACEGENVDYQRMTADSRTADHMVKARRPELFELQGIEAALEKSVPGNIGSDGKGLKFYFLAENLISELNPLATFQNDKSGRGTVYLWPQVQSVSYPTEADLPEAERKLPFSDRRRSETLESAVVHELGHNNFLKLGYDQKSSTNDIGTQMSTEGEKIAEQMGWVKRRDAENTDADWYLLGKSRDDNGQHSSYRQESNVFISSWTRWRKEGGAVDKDGKVVPADKAQSLSEDEIRKEAVVPPATWYFDRPEEEYAESFKLYRLGGSARKELHDVSPALYRIVSYNDQIEIDNAYGKLSDGSSRMIRNVDGLLVENNMLNQELISSFEQSAPAAAKLPYLLSFIGAY